jgi:enamine deaminase RidA (YjgF/YER057c/UK114 family)
MSHTLREAITTNSISSPSGHFAQGNVVSMGGGRLVFVSGMTARDERGDVFGVGDVRAQTRRVCENIAAVLEAVGGSLQDVCRVDVYVRDMADFAAIHEVRREFFTGILPASTMVEVSRLVHTDMLVEITAIAALDGSVQERQNPETTTKSSLPS